MKTLVTGGAGFIGSHFVRSLLADGTGQEAVTVLDALTYAGNLANLRSVQGDPRLRFVQGDILDSARVAELVAGHDAVVNLAAESHVDRSIANGAKFSSTNVLGTQTLLEAAVQAGGVTVVHVSTDEVYGSIPIGSWTEEEPLAPNSPYAAAKAGSDLLALAYHRTHGLDVRITRCSNNYGPYQFPEKIIPLFITRLLQGRKVPLYGDGSQIRDWLHVVDHCRAIRLVLEGGRAGEIYNVGGGTELTNKHLTDRLLDACGADWDSVEHVADRKGHDQRYSVDWSKIRDELGYEPRHTFDEGLASTVSWYRQNRDWWRR
ncbi:dTDP-glucose 4,6-dehydratase [Streptomyces paromomycinus]|uniref:dTDP-glucose 4,6-dehydratase n=1 Tax=Streptomyces paromomycinus TaxID=92743 RepID=Q9KK63_STREY|nr:dTDP-glucose 4,6-dehydratase [Streptomyces paromomycinus]AAF82605.1 dTDP-glucose 4,6-dehydratase [Streptomyces paromomycinus]GCD44729.1 dTDP-glucose 4,6-dehydratase [Streptomyces paromomycinus]